MVKLLWPKCSSVARGFLQEPGKYFIQLCPNSSSWSIRLLVGRAVKDNLSMHHFEIAQAFVQAALTEEIHLKLPPGCRDLTGNTMWLHKSFDGSPHSAFELNKLLSEKRLGLGF